MTRDLLRPLCCVLFGVVVACGAGPEQGTRPPLILISIDTLRSDRLPVYGHAGVSTPAIDALRADGVLFERAYSPVPLTLPAHASMLTGTLPPEHGVRDNLGYPFETADAPYLPRLLGASGYSVGGAVSSFVLRAESGMGADFDLYEDRVEGGEKRPTVGPERAGAETLEAVLPWLRSVSGQPFFLFFHLYEPHRPYTPPEPYLSRYGATYEGEIAAADAAVGALLAELKQLGVYDRAVIALTSDHGEGLGDHGEMDHGIFLYRESLQVPLILKLPDARRAGEVVTRPVPLIDLAPTFIELAALEKPDGMRGRSLLAAGEDEPDRSIYAETYIPRLHFGWNDLLALIEGRYHYIDSPRPQLFDVEADPEETTDLIDQLPDVARTMRRKLAAERRDAGPPSNFDDRVLQKMTALGYLGGARSRFGGELPAPHTQTHLIRVLTLARRALSEGRWQEAVDGFGEIVAENPYMVYAWQQMGTGLTELGRFGEALAAYERVIEMAGREPQIMLPMAQVLANLGRYGEARTAAGEAADVYPAQAQAVIADLALAQGDLDGAEAAANAALAADPEAIGPWLSLSQVARRRGQGELALERARRADELAGESPVRGVQFLLGAALGDVGRTEEAERSMFQELERFPDALRAYRYLAMLYARSGRAGDSQAALQRMVESNPTPRGYLVAIRTLTGLGDAAGAEALLAYAIDRFPDSLELRALTSGA